MKLSKRPVNLTHLTWGANPYKSIGLGGTYHKAYEKGKHYKLSAYDDLYGIVGYESIYESLAYELLQEINISTTPYVLQYATVKVNNNSFNTFVCISDDFRLKNTKTSAINFYCALQHSGETPVDLFKRFGFEEELNTLFFVDFLIGNRDRHGENVEVIANGDSLSMSKLFDNGISFLAPYGTNINSVKAFDITSDIQGNNFFGSYSLMENLNLITNKVHVKDLSDSALDSLLYTYSEILPSVYISKIKQMIKWRYDYAKHRGILYTG